MLALWWIGRPLEDYLGPLRYLLLYLVSGLAGSAGALIVNPTGVTVGASGAIFGILGAAIVLERQGTYVLGGSAITLLVVNLAFTFAVPGISIGGHLGGLAGGALCILALSRFGKGSAAYSRIDVVSIASIVAIGAAQRRRRVLEGERLRLGGLSRRSRRRPMPCSASAAWAAARRASGTRYGRAADVVEPEPVAERDRLRLAAVLAADAELEVLARAAAALDRDLHQVADAVLVDRLERVALEDAGLEVVREEAAGVVAGEAERGLRQVVRAEGEEVGVLGDLVGADARARQLDHRPDEVLELALLGRDAHGQLAEPLQLLAEADERDA